MKKQRVIVSVINDLSGDQRAHRIASALQRNQFEVELIGRKLPDSLPLAKRAYRMHRMKLFFRKGKLFYLEYNIRLFFLLMSRKVDILNANDLDTLLANFLVSRLRRKKLVYDSHEYFTEVPELIGRPRTRSIWLRLESWLFPRLEHVYTVNSSLAEIYQEAYQRPVKVIRNVPVLKETKGPGQRNRLLYQGALNVGRGLELMIDAMEFLPNHELWIIGKGDIEQVLLTRAQKSSLVDSRVFFKGFISLEELHSMTCQAGIGLSLEEDLGLNYHYSSPNKIYDYLQAGLPVLVSELPEMTQLVASYEAGLVLPNDMRTPRGLAQKVLELSEEKTYEELQKNAIFAGQELNWEQEEARLLEIYRTG